MHEPVRNNGAARDVPRPARIFDPPKFLTGSWVVGEQNFGSGTDQLLSVRVFDQGWGCVRPAIVAGLLYERAFDVPLRKSLLA
jgi:hypothetical protein